MKKIFLMVFIALATVCSVSGKDGAAPSKRHLPITEKAKQNEFKMHRAPMRLPIEVIHDSDTQTIEVSTDSDLQGEVCLYHDGTLIDSSPEINVTFPLPFSYGEYTVNITGDWWEATAVLEL